MAARASRADAGLGAHLLRREARAVLVALRAAVQQLKDRILFGSDYPLITPDRWLKDFEEAGFKDSVKPLILKQNAMRLLGLS